MKTRHIIYLVINIGLVATAIWRKEYCEAMAWLACGIAEWLWHSYEDNYEEAKKDIAALAEECDAYKNAYHEECRDTQVLREECYQLKMENNRLQDVYVENRM